MGNLAEANASQCKLELYGGVQPLCKGAVRPEGTVGVEFGVLVTV